MKMATVSAVIGCRFAAAVVLAGLLAAPLPAGAQVSSDETAVQQTYPQALVDEWNLRFGGPARPIQKKYHFVRLGPELPSGLRYIAAAYSNGG